jgi:tetratricopeptide (TPR) repeat protein
MNRKQRRAAKKFGRLSNGLPNEMAISTGVAEFLATGLQHHQAGRLAEAESCYRRVLLVQSEHADALNMRGVIAFQLGRHELAVELIDKAIKHNGTNPSYFSHLGMALREQGKIDRAIAAYRQAIHIKPDYAEAYCNLGVALRDQGRQDEAIAACRQAIAIKPDLAEAHRNLGVALRDQGKYDEAIAAYRQAARIKPDYAGAHFNLGLALGDQGNLEEAIVEYRRAIGIKPDFAQAYCNLGIALQGQGKLNEAIAEYRQAVRIKPDYADVHSNLAVALRDQGNLDEAIAAGRRAIGIKPDHAKGYCNLGVALRDRGQLDEAIAAYQRAIGIKPDYAEAHSNLGVALGDQGKFEEAIAAGRRAIDIKPDYAEGYCNLGVALRDQGKLDEAMAAYQRAIGIKPDLAEAHNNLGVALRDRRKLDEAIASYDKALAIKPDYADAHFSKGLACLLTGNFADGWREYEWRWETKEQSSQKRGFAQPLWLGKEPLAGRTILLHGEQGLGDTLMAVRYAPRVAETGAKVILEAPASLRSLVTHIRGVAQIVPQGEALPAFDMHCPLMSLPLAFDTALRTIPAEVPYLVAPKDRVVYWQHRLGDAHGTRIGIVWSGNQRNKNDRYHTRSIPLQSLAALRFPHAQLVSLQKELRVSDRELLSQYLDILHFGPELTSFAETAALVSLMDLVISVDTSVAHLAGAMAKPVWILLPFLPDWRWLLDREDSPWYPTARLFRQPAHSDWDSVIARVKEEILILSKRRPTGRSSSRASVRGL